jgi:hypothetical protein
VTVDTGVYGQNPWVKGLAYVVGYIDASGNPVITSIPGGEWVRLTDGTNGELDISLANSTTPLATGRPWIRFGNSSQGTLEINAGANGYIEIAQDANTSVYFNADTLRLASGKVAIYGAVNTAANGVSAMRGIDDRADVAATDGSAITVYAIPAGVTDGSKYRITATVVGSSGTVTAASYVIKYTVDTAVVTHTLSISAVDTDAEYCAIVAPDASSNITAQLTTLTGTTPKVDLCCLVEGISSGT